LIQLPREAFRKSGKGRDGTSVGDKLLDDVRGHVWKRYGGRFEELAVEAGLHEKTVEKFAWGDTKKPHFETVARLLAALDLLDLLKQVLLTGMPVTRAQAQQRKR